MGLTIYKTFAFCETHVLRICVCGCDKADWQYTYMTKNLYLENIHGLGSFKKLDFCSLMMVQKKICSNLMFLYLCLRCMHLFVMIVGLIYWGFCCCCLVLCSLYCLFFIVELPLSWKTKHSFILIENHPHFQNKRKFPHTDRNV